MSLFRREWPIEPRGPRGQSYRGEASRECELGNTFGFLKLRSYGQPQLEDLRSSHAPALRPGVLPEDAAVNPGWEYPEKVQQVIAGMEGSLSEPDDRSSSVRPAAGTASWAFLGRVRPLNCQRSSARCAGMNSGSGGPYGYARAPNGCLPSGDHDRTRLIRSA